MRASLDQDGELACPSCGPACLHFEGSSPYDYNDRPGIALVFSCEFCGQVRSLTVINHKGYTQMVWSP